MHLEKKIKQKSNGYFLKVSFFSFVFFSFFSIYVQAQDSIPEKKDLLEEASLKFQENFFNALSEKSIGNHLKAISNLESCNEILPNNVAVFFEFSKNYFALNNLFLANEYIKRALNKEPNNLWMLKHQVKILEKENNFKQAIQIQQKISENYPKEREKLVILYVFNKDYEKALKLMDVLEKENMLSSALKDFRKKLLDNNQRKKTKKNTNITDLEVRFSKEKSYQTLEKILNISKNNPSALLKYSEEGLQLFPAQAFIYLMHGKALNDTNNSKKALLILQTGIDFVIEQQMEVRFYKEIAKSYKNLGQEEEAKKYLLKAKKIKI